MKEDEKMKREEIKEHRIEELEKVTGGADTFEELEKERDNIDPNAEEIIHFPIAP